jgi:hypothetical protein
MAERLKAFCLWTLKKSALRVRILREAFRGASVRILDEATQGFQIKIIKRLSCAADTKPVQFDIASTATK